MAIRGVCIECNRKRDLYRPVVQHVDGTMQWICKQCWVLWDYAPFFWPKG